MQGPGLVQEGVSLGDDEIANGRMQKLSKKTVIGHRIRLALIAQSQQVIQGYVRASRFQEGSNMVDAIRFGLLEKYLPEPGHCQILHVLCCRPGLYNQEAKHRDQSRILSPLRHQRLKDGTAGAGRAGCQAGDELVHRCRILTTQACQHLLPRNPLWQTANLGEGRQQGR